MNHFFKPTLQTTFNEKGNCLAAIISTMFDVAIEEVPFFDEDEWIEPLSKWAASRLGKFIVPVRLNEISDNVVFCGSLMMTAINSDNPRVERHIVITKNKRIIFDPMIGEVDKALLNHMEPTFLVPNDVRGFLA